MKPLLLISAFCFLLSAFGAVQVLPNRRKAFQPVAPAAGDGLTSWVTSYTPGTPPRNDAPGYVGAVFTPVGANITVKKVGCYVLAGGTETHTISICNGTTVIVTANLNFTGLSTGWHYVTVADTVLTAGVTYSIGLSITAGGDFWSASPGSTTTTAVATLDGAGYSGSACAAVNLGPGQYVGMDFRY